MYIKQMYSGISIRPVTPNDIQEVIDLRIQASLDAYSLAYVQDEAFGPAPTLMLVAHRGDELVATAYAKISPQDHNSDSYIGGLYIASSARRSGLGSQLLEQRLQWLRDQGCRKVLTEVERTNTPAMNLMHKYGFVEESILPWDKYIEGVVWSVQTLNL
jgi:ribosomal protein S18 acetylase RimI-like enzyme